MCSFGHLYMISMLQEVKPPEHGWHVPLHQWLLCFSHHIPKVLDQVYFSDKVWFHLLGHIYAQNFCIWCLEYPHEYQVTLSVASANDRCTSWLQIIRLDFFFNAMVTAECCREFAFNFISQHRNDVFTFSKMEHALIQRNQW